MVNITFRSYTTHGQRRGGGPRGTLDNGLREVRLDGQDSQDAAAAITKMATGGHTVSQSVSQSVNMSPGPRGDTRF